LKGDILASVHLRLLLLNNYDISSIYEYPVWRLSRAKQLQLEKGGDAPRYHPGIKNLIKTISFLLCAIHEKHNFKYFKNPTLKVCKIWWNDVFIVTLFGGN
jgi:hypothetical protein